MPPDDNKRLSLELLTPGWQFGTYSMASVTRSLADLGWGGGRAGCTPSHMDPILLFSHTFSPKSACIGGKRPRDGCTPPPTGNPGSATEDL